MFGPLLSRSLSELGLFTDAATGAPRGFFCFAGSEPSLDAFGAMVRAGVSALGILNEDGALVANLSYSDLRVVLPDRWGVLAIPVHRLLELECAGGFGASRKGGRMRGAVAVTPDASLGEALHVMVQHGLHHVFVAGGEDGRSPLAVVSTTDVMRLVLPRRE